MVEQRQTDEVERGHYTLDNNQIYFRKVFIRTDEFLSEDDFLDHVVDHMRFSLQTPLYWSLNGWGNFKAPVIEGTLEIKLVNGGES